MTEEELKELASQLGSPTGKMGVEVANMLNDSNIEMTLSAIDALDLKERDVVLELGHGNAGHLSRILSKASGLRYYGLEISETMMSEAGTINREFVADSRASFHLYEGRKIPFETGQFDKIMSVNTLYFWEQPAELMAEITRVLKPGGRLVLCYAPREFMQNLPFTKYGFRLYSDQEVRELTEAAELQIMEVRELRDEVQSPHGEPVHREYRAIMAEKR